MGISPTIDTQENMSKPDHQFHIVPSRSQYEPELDLEVVGFHQAIGSCILATSKREGGPVSSPFRSTPKQLSQPSKQQKYKVHSEEETCKKFIQRWVNSKPKSQDWSLVLFRVLLIGNDSFARVFFYLGSQGLKDGLGSTFHKNHQENARNLPCYSFSLLLKDGSIEQSETQ